MLSFVLNRIMGGTGPYEDEIFSTNLIYLYDFS